MFWETDVNVKNDLDAPLILMLFLSTSGKHQNLTHNMDIKTLLHFNVKPKPAAERGWNSCRGGENPPEITETLYIYWILVLNIDQCNFRGTRLDSKFIYGLDFTQFDETFERQKVGPPPIRAQPISWKYKLTSGSRHNKPRPSYVL